MFTTYVPAVGKWSGDLQLAGASGGLGVHVGEGAEVFRVAMRCIHASWLRVRSVDGFPVSASTTMTR